MARLTYRKSIKIAPGVRLNVTQRGLSSISAGAGGLRVNQSLRGSSSRRPAARPAASAGPTLAERIKADDARRTARLEAKLGVDGLARRKQVNAAIYKWCGVTVLWAFSLVLPPLLLVALPVTVWVVVRAVRARRVLAGA